MLKLTSDDLHKVFRIINSKFIFIFLALFFSINSNANSINVSLISVADKKDPFWKYVHNYAMKAALDFNIELEILYSNRDHTLAIKTAKALTLRKKKPDYVIVVGEKSIAVKSIPILSNGGIKVFLLGDVTKSELHEIGLPKEKYNNYLGKLKFDDYMSGYSTADLMINKAIKNQSIDSKENINFLMIEGVAQTPFNLDRVKGAKDAFNNYPNINIIQSVTTDWSYQKSKYITKNLLKRYQHIKISGVWCASGELARGASDALKEYNKDSEINYSVTGTDWDLESVISVSKGEVLALSGGHMLSAAWLITLINDHNNGIDLGNGLFQQKNMIMDKAMSENYLYNISHNTKRNINFKHYSKAANQNLKHYKFHAKELINNTQ